MLYNGIFGCQGNICYVILINAFLQDAYYRSNQCVYQFWDQSLHTVMDAENLQKIECFIWRHVTQKRDAVHHGDLIRLIGISTILRSIGTHIDEFRKYAKIVFYLTSRDTKMVRRTSWGLDTSIRNTLKPTRSPYDFRFKSYGSNWGFHDFETLILTFDLCSILCRTH